jgi:general secretion pathway protein G
MILRTKDRRHGLRHGFTLMEILVVVAIILVLASLGGYYIIGAANDARKSTAKAQIKQIEQGVEAFNLKHLGQWPPNLQSLIVKDEMGGPYLKNHDYIIDPWGREYQYNAAGPRNGGIQPDIWTVTPEGQEIGNWPSKGTGGI